MGYITKAREGKYCETCLAKIIYKNVTGFIFTNFLVFNGVNIFFNVKIYYI